MEAVEDVKLIQEFAANFNFKVSTFIYTLYRVYQDKRKRMKTVQNIDSLNQKSMLESFNKDFIVRFSNINYIL